MQSENNVKYPTYWIFPGNPKYFDIHSYIDNYNGVIYWKQDGSSPTVGDLVYMYIASPEQRLRYFMKVIETNIIPSNNILDEVRPFRRVEPKKPVKKYCQLKVVSIIDNPSLSNKAFENYGFTSKNNQINRKWKLTNIPDFFEYITVNHLHLAPYIDANEITQQESEGRPEGAIKRILVNKYERNPINRRECIEHYGTKCHICGFDFEEKYGEMGKGFIHVHHVIPLSEVNNSYVINPQKDLIPVCPNCHAMLHKGKNGVTITPEELKRILQM